jgi:hypothetical protein
LYGFETYSLSLSHTHTLREEHGYRMSENRVLRGIFGPKGEEVAGGWRRLHNEELHNLYNSPSIIRAIKSRRMRWASHVARMEDIRNAYEVLVWKPVGTGHPEDLGRWKDNIRVDLTDIA